MLHMSLDIQILLGSRFEKGDSRTINPRRQGLRADSSGRHVGDDISSSGMKQNYVIKYCTKRKEQ